MKDELKECDAGLSWRAKLSLRFNRQKPLKQG
jgi:hypothetical protein